VVGHESVDPKPQEKSDLVYWRDFILSTVCHGVCVCVRVCLCLRESVRTGAYIFTLYIVIRDIFIKRRRWVKAKGNPVLIPEPGCGYVREIRINPRFLGRGNATQTGEAVENPGKSFLFCLRDRDHGIPSWSEMVLDTRC